MANLKIFYFPYESTGATDLYARVFQSATGKWLDYSDWTFKAIPTNPKIPLTEVHPGTSVYSFETDEGAWEDGKYQAFGYLPSNYLFAGGELFILNDTEVGLDVLLEYMELIKKIEEGNWELKEISGQAYWIYYDTDGATPLMQFKCLDKDGNSSLSNIFKRVRS